MGGRSPYLPQMHWRDKADKFYLQKDGDKEDRHLSEHIRRKEKPAAPPGYTERVKIVPYDDGWQEYEEASVKF